MLVELQNSGTVNSASTTHRKQLRNSVLTSESILRLTNGASKEGSSSSRIVDVFVEEEVTILQEDVEEGISTCVIGVVPLPIHSAE